MVRVAADRIAPGERPCGRTPGSVGVVMGAVTVVDPDGLRARNRARVEVAMYVDVVGPLDPTVCVDPDLLARLHDRVAAGDDEGAARLIPDDLLDRFALAGTPAQVTERVQRLFEAGAARVDFGPPLGLSGVGPALALLAGHVLPGLR